MSDIYDVYIKLKEVERDVDLIKQRYSTYTDDYRRLVKLSKCIDSCIDSAMLVWYCENKKILDR